MSTDREVLIKEMKAAVRAEERERKYQLSKCWGMPSGLEPPEFEAAVSRQRRLKRWLELLGDPFNWKTDGLENYKEDGE